MLGIVFPGQGSQAVGMLGEMAVVYPEIELTFHEASEILGYDLWRLVQEGPAESLNQTLYTQPAVLVASYAIWQIIRSQTHLQPAILAGHSLGEYTALLAAEALSFPDAIRLVAARAQFMQAAVPAGQGALAAIVGLAEAVVQQLCEEAVEGSEVLMPANFNSPGQIVIGGSTSAVLRAIDLAKAARAKIATLLPVSVPSHCLLMKPAAEKLQALLQTLSIKQPHIQVVNNVDATFYTSPSAIVDGLYRQLFMPVQWVKCMQVFLQQNVTHCIECGPGKVLSGLNKRMMPGIQLTQTGELANLQDLLNTNSQERQEEK